MNNEELEIMIENLSTTVHENCVMIAEMSEEIETLNTVLENMNIGELMLAVEELQNEVADVAKVPVGMLFSRLKMKGC